MADLRTQKKTNKIILRLPKDLVFAVVLVGAVHQVPLQMVIQKTLH
jgi:hypothetical protein